MPPVKNSFDRTRSTLVGPKDARTTSLASPVTMSSKASPLTKMPTISPPVESVHPALRSVPSSASVAPSTTTLGSDADYEGRRSLQALSEKLLGRAMREGDPARKERLLNFAKVTVHFLSGMSKQPSLTLRSGPQRLADQRTRSADLGRDCSKRST